MTKMLKYFTMLIFILSEYQGLCQKLPSSSLYGVYSLEEASNSISFRKLDWQIIICKDNRVLIKAPKINNSKLTFLKKDSIPNCFSRENLEFKLNFNFLVGKYEIQHDTIMILLNNRQNISFKIVDSLNLRIINKNSVFPKFRANFAHKVSGFYHNHWFCGVSGSNNTNWVYCGDTYDTLLINRRNNFWMFADTTKSNIYEQLDAFRIYDTTAYPKYKQ